MNTHSLTKRKIYLITNTPIIVYCYEYFQNSWCVRENNKKNIETTYTLYSICSNIDTPQHKYISTVQIVADESTDRLTGRGHSDIWHLIYDKTKSSISMLYNVYQYETDSILHYLMLNNSIKSIAFIIFTQPQHKNIYKGNNLA